MLEDTAWYRRHLQLVPPELARHDQYFGNQEQSVRAEFTSDA
ncbi:hypothetical protein N826_31495 [Skermanella aerolata KACC 11604]|nr:hypothetical protein N826_31495 [Skermanella aerolata KACC 11604]